MARLDIPVMGDYDYFRRPEPWCCAEVNYSGLVSPYGHTAPFTINCTIDEFKENIKNYIQDMADELCIKSYQFCDMIGSITSDIYGDNTIKILFVCKVSKSEVIKFKHSVYEYMDKLRVRFYAECYRLDFNLEVIETEPIQELAIIFKEENIMKQLPEIKKVIHSGDYTHIIWEDDTKTSVKRAEETPDDPYSAFAQAVIKKLYGSTEKAKFEHELKQKSDKEQKKILAEKAKRREKQEKAESKKRVKAKKLNKEIDDTEKYLKDLKRKAKDFLGD